jgi:hypothetical protein
MTDRTKQVLLNNSRVIDMLSFRQILKLTFWEFFVSWRTDIFYQSLQGGKHAMAAYDDAVNGKK